MEAITAFATNTYFGNTIPQYVYFLGTIAIAIIVGKIIGWISKNILMKKAAKTKNKADDLAVGLIERPLVFLVFVAGLFFGKGFLILSGRVDEIFTNVISILITLDVAWFIMNAIDIVLINYITPMLSKTKSDLDDHILPLLRKLVKFIIIVVTIVMIIDNFGYDVSSILAGLGIGGLAFALAAKDILSNFFGGIAIVTDRPFKIGDRIRIDEKTDGWVKEIGLRTTKIETLDGTKLTIPNSMLVDNILENVSAENARKIRLNIGVEYGTSIKKMEQAKKIVQDVVKKNKHTKDESIVSFTEFGDSSLNFLIIYWIKNMDEILSTRHEVNMEIKKQFEKAKIEFAFPSRTIYTRKG